MLDVCLDNLNILFFFVCFDSGNYLVDGFVYIVGMLSSLFSLFLVILYNSMIGMYLLLILRIVFSSLMSTDVGTPDCDEKSFFFWFNFVDPRSKCVFIP
ncbi:hypothetical protein BpHYR1_041766 [Brachionus plicatilis]|uniref:Uncharacterized protein n=1 Tax=Brachionus plicatilis TaxID=10195 RepID=A0A3M7QBI7_BRAPC|nr:hypothetical protein BpHYR1_041766 [Brachionus plicatilis]